MLLEEIWQLKLLPWDDQVKQMAQDQDQQENFPEFIIDRLLQPNNRNLYFKFNEVCEVLKNTNTQIKIEEIQTSKEWLPFAQTVIRMETLMKLQCAAQILIEKFQEWETVKSTKLISEEQVNIDNISNDWLRSFGYRRTEKYPGFEFTSKTCQNWPLMKMILENMSKHIQLGTMITKFLITTITGDSN